MLCCVVRILLVLPVVQWSSSSSTDVVIVVVVVVLKSVLQIIVFIYFPLESIKEFIHVCYNKKKENICAN